MLHNRQVPELQDIAVNMSSEQLEAMCLTGIDIETPQSGGLYDSDDDSDSQMAVEPDRSPCFLDASLEYETDIELKRFCGLPLYHNLVQSMSNERPSSVPPPESAASGTVHHEDGVDGVHTDDEIDTGVSRDVDEPDASSLDVVDGGNAPVEDGIWSDEDGHDKTVSKSYVRVKEPATQTRSVTAKRFVI